MDNTVTVAVLSLVGTLVGSGGGILIANKLVNYRLDQIEKKVGIHNNFEGRLNGIESNCGQQRLKCEACFAEADHKLENHVLLLHPQTPPLH